MKKEIGGLYGEQNLLRLTDILFTIVKELEDQPLYMEVVRINFEVYSQLNRESRDMLNELQEQLLRA